MLVQASDNAVFIRNLRGAEPEDVWRARLLFVLRPAMGEAVARASKKKSRYNQCR